MSEVILLIFIIISPIFKLIYDICIGPFFVGLSWEWYAKTTFADAGKENYIKEREWKKEHPLNQYKNTRNGCVLIQKNKESTKMNVSKEKEQVYDRN